VYGGDLDGGADGGVNRQVAQDGVGDGPRRFTERFVLAARVRVGDDDLAHTRPAVGIDLDPHKRVRTRVPPGRRRGVLGFALERHEHLDHAGHDEVVGDGDHRAP
jgi:hypothetical protein